MTNYDYLIVGGGMSAAAAAQAIRETDVKGTIGMISAEKNPPYNRPPLTKKLWQGKPENSIWRKLPQENLELILDCRVVSLDPAQKLLRTEDGQIYGYGKLLLATGGSPRRLPFGPVDMLYYRTLDDYHAVQKWIGKGARIGIIGGGFIGSEIAASLAANGEKVVMVFPEDGLSARIFPKDLSEYVNRYYQQKGVEVRTGIEIHAIEAQGEGYRMRAKDGQSVEVDHIIAGIGILPNTQLAKEAGITIAEREDGAGIKVDEQLRTNLTDIFAAGDVASFFNTALQRWTRVEHEDNANSMGRTAGLNMAGKETSYDHQPYFYSDLFDLGYEAVGELDSRMETFADWVEPFEKGVVYYLRDEKVRGVLLWNTWDQVDHARSLIAEDRIWRPDELKGRLPK